MLQNLYRLVSIYSDGYIIRELVIFKLALGLLFIGLAVYGIVANFALFLFASCVFCIDYVVYRAYMVERFHRIEKSATHFNIYKLLDAEGAYRPITEDELENPLYTEETEYLTRDIGNRVLEDANLALDMGCGSGVLTLELLKKGIRTISLDATSRSLKLTDEVARRHGYSSERVLADAQHLPFRESCFDLAIALSVIEHLPDDILGFKESARVTKLGKRAIFSFPSRHSPVFSIYGFLFNPITLFERLVSWELPQILPKRTKFVYLGELFLTRNKTSFDDVSIHRSYDHKALENALMDLGLVTQLVGYLSARGRRLPIQPLQKLVTRYPCLAHTFIVIGVRQR